MKCKDILGNLGLGDIVKLAAGALQKKGGEVIGDVVIDGILTTKNAEVVIEKESGFSGIHIKNGSSQASSACGIDFSFGGAIMASIIGGMMPTGANYLDVALSPPGGISDRRQSALTLNGDVKRMFFQNGWLLDGYARYSDFTQSMADAGWVRFPNGTIIQWYWGATDVNGWGGIVWPIAWPIRCHGVVAVNIAGDVPSSAVAGVRRIDDRNFWVTLREITGAVSIKPFFCIGIGV